MGVREGRQTSARYLNAGSTRRPTSYEDVLWQRETGTPHESSDHADMDGQPG